VSRFDAVARRSTSWTISDGGAKIDPVYAPEASVYEASLVRA
jgi:hypothetical protein